MILHTLKSIQKFASASRKYKDLEVAASHCIDKLKFFTGYVQLGSEKEFEEIGLDSLSRSSLKEYLGSPINSEIKNVVHLVDKRKVKEVSFEKYAKYMDLLYPFVLGPIYKSCRQYASPKLLMITLEGIHKLLSFELLSGILVDETKLFGCEELVQGEGETGGVEFLIRLVFQAFDNKAEDESLTVQILKAGAGQIGKNLENFSKEIYYSMFLVLVNIFSSTIDTGIRNSSQSILFHLVSLLFDDSFEQRRAYFEKYFRLILEVLYPLSVTTSMILIKKSETRRGCLSKLVFISPLEFGFSEEFVDVELNFFKFSQIRELDPRVLRIRSLSLELLGVVFGQLKLEKYSKDLQESSLNDFFKLHILSILKNTVLSDFQVRASSLKLWSSTIRLFNLRGTVRVHGIFISKCIMGLIEKGVLEVSEKTQVVESVFKLLIGDIQLLSLLFVEFDLQLHEESLVLALLNFLFNQLLEDPSPRAQQKGSNEIFGLLKEFLEGLNSLLRPISRSPEGLSGGSELNNGLQTIRKYLIGEYIRQFNGGNYERSLQLLSEIGVVNKEDEASIAELLARNKSLDKKAIGDFISLPDSRNRQVLKQYCERFSFKDQSLDFSLYMFLSNFHLPGEAQKIDRIIEEFSLKYFQDNPQLLDNKDKVYILAFSLILLHTDAHNREIKDYYRMTKNDFIKNHSDLVFSSPSFVEHLETFYDNITLNEWNFDVFKDCRRVPFPFFEYLLNFIYGLDILDTTEIRKSGPQIKILSHEITRKIANLLKYCSSSSSNSRLLRLTYQKIRKRFEILCFDKIYTEDLVYWRLISSPNSLWNQNVGESLKERHLPIWNMSLQEGSDFQYDGIEFKKLTRTQQPNYSQQSSNTVGGSQNLSKWISNNRTCDWKIRDLNGIFQSCISELIKEFGSSSEVHTEEKRDSSLKTGESVRSDDSSLALVGRMVCCYFSKILSNVHFWLYFGRDHPENWICILKLISEMGIILGMESSFSVTLTVIAYLTNLATLPLAASDVFLPCRSGLEEETRNVQNEEVALNSKGLSEAPLLPTLEGSFESLVNCSDLVLRSLHADSLCLKAHSDLLEAPEISEDGVKNKIGDESEYTIEVENKPEDENDILLSQTLSSVNLPDLPLSFLVSSEYFCSSSTLSSSNLEAIKAIFEITIDFGDRIPNVLWVIIVGILSQVDRHFYLKSIIKGNFNESPDHFDHSRLLVPSKSKVFGNELSDFLALSKIRINSTKSKGHSSHYGQMFTRKLVKSTKSMFNSAKSSASVSVANSSCENSRIVSRDTSSRETSPGRSNREEETSRRSIYGKESQFIQVFVNLKRSISLNNLWFKKEEVTGLDFGNWVRDDEAIWIDQERYSFIASQISLVNLRRVEVLNSKLITNQFEFCQITEKLFSKISQEPRWVKAIPSFFLALVFNTRSQMVSSGRKSVELLLLRKVFELLDLIVEYKLREFPDLTLWDNYFVPVFFHEVVQSLDGKAVYMALLDLIKSFLFKFVRSQDALLRHENQLKDKTNEKQLIIVSRNLGIDLSAEALQFSPKDVKEPQNSALCLLRQLLDICQDTQPYPDFISVVELSVEVVSGILDLYQTLKFLNFRDYSEILDLYALIITSIHSNSERLQGANSMGTGSNKKKKLFALIGSPYVNMNKEDSTKEKETEILTRIYTCLTTSNKLPFILDDSVFVKLLDIFSNIFKISIKRNDGRLIRELSEFILFAIYKKLKHIQTKDLESLFASEKIKDWRLSLTQNTQAYSNNILGNIWTIFTSDPDPAQIKLVFSCLNEFLRTLTRGLVFEKRLLDLYYHYLITISKILSFWLSVCFQERLAQDPHFLQKTLSETLTPICFVGRRSLGNGVVLDSTGRRVRFIDRIVLERDLTLDPEMEEEMEFEAELFATKNGFGDSDPEDLYFDEEENEDDEEDDDFDDSCFVDEEADLSVIKNASYTSARSEKCNFEVTNKDSHLDNTQLTLTNSEELEVKLRIESGLAVLNKKIWETNIALSSPKERKSHLVLSEFLDDSHLDVLGSFKHGSEEFKAIRILQNVYKIFEFYIFKNNIRNHKFLLRDWLAISHRILVSQTMRIFCKEDIRTQFRILTTHLRFIYINKTSFCSRDWLQVVQHFSGLLLDFTRTIQIDPRNYIIEDLKKRYSVDDLGITYRENAEGSQEKRLTKDDALLCSRAKQNHLESFFKPKLFSKRYFWWVESKKSHPRENKSETGKPPRYKKKEKGKSISLRQCLEKNWRCYSHKLIKNTGDQEMYDSYSKLTRSLEELLLEILAERRADKKNSRPAPPDCILDLYSVFLVAFKLVFDWYVSSLSTWDRELDLGLNRMIYDSVLNSLNTTAAELLQGLSLVKFDVFQFNIYLVFGLRIHVKREFSSRLKEDLPFLALEYFSECEDMISRYSRIEKERSNLSEDHHSEKKRGSITNSNVHFSPHFNQIYENLLKNKIDLKNVYRAVLNHMLREMKESEKIVKNTHYYKLLLDITLLEDQQLRILSRDILLEFRGMDSHASRDLHHLSFGAR
ncbi:large Sec7 domain containing protein [Cryptosporidium felis]|nr:large Sec7 domain containing protein [Cryptosporidium felis]